ncbi:hypothetical protein [Peribacillus muralis]|uniref:hypothetical protein n=1 Tax=Peribacillus muralis TaxID=264697 RepID=UPI0031F454F5
MDFQPISRGNWFLKGRFSFVFDEGEPFISLGGDVDIDMKENVLKNERFRL